MMNSSHQISDEYLNYGTVKSQISMPLKKIVLTWDNINVFSPLMRDSGMSSLASLLFKKSDRNFEGLDKESQVPTSAQDDISKYKHILKNASGIIEPGTLLAVMGSSGSGKTTLLNVLTFRNRGNLVIQGEVRINGVKIEKAMPGVSCYVQQENLFLPTITVKEQLWFHSQLRMDRHTTKEMRKTRIEEVLQEMGLHKCSDVMVGSPGKIKGVSGGEMKRLALALELLTNPPLLFLDEPMSGLDSYMAKNVLVILKKMSESGRSVVCTIHQPTSEMFEMFDKLLIVCEGRSAYMGPAKEASKYFESCHYPMPPNYNPAEHFMKVLAVEPGSEDLSRKRIEKICDQFLLTKHSSDIHDRIEAINSTEDKFVQSSQKRNERESSYKATWFRQFYAVLWRCAVNNLREPSVFWNKLVQLLILSLLSGFLFWQQKLDQQGVISLNGILFHMQLQPSFVFGLGVIQTFPPELPLFFKEHLDGMYRVDVYFLCKVAVEIPQLIILPLLYSTTLYWIVGLYRSAGAYLINCTCIILVCSTATAFGYFISSAIKNPKIANTSVSTLVSLITLIGGFFIHPSSVPLYFIWLKTISWIAHSNEILLVNQWSNIESIECNVEGANMTKAADLVGSARCFHSGKDVIEFFGYKEGTIGFNFVMIILLMVCYTFVAFLCLLIRSKGSYKMEKSRKSY